MKRTLQLLAFSLTVVLVFALGACQTDERQSSLFDPNYTGRPAPVIDSVAPTGNALMGATQMTIYGANFSAVPEENSIYFSGFFKDKTVLSTVKPTQVLSNPSRLIFTAPGMVEDTNITASIRVGVFRAEPFSNSVSYDLFPAVKKYGFLEVAGGEEAVCIAADTAGVLYYSRTIGGAGGGIIKVDELGVRSMFAPLSGVLRWFGLKVGPSNNLYGVRQTPFIFTVPPGAATASNLVTWASPSNGIPTTIRLSDLDFDADKNLWAVGFASSGTKTIVRLTPTKTGTVAYDFRGILRTVRVYNGFLYFGGVRYTATDTLEGVWRAPISGGTIDTAQITEYFNFKAAYGSTAKVNAITFSDDGYMYIGTDHSAAIVIVAPGGSSHEALYPGIFRPQTVTFAWGKGTFLFFARQASAGSTPQLYILNTLKNGAPYYGSL